MCWVIFRELFETFEHEYLDHRLHPQKIGHAAFHYSHPNAQRVPVIKSKKCQTRDMSSSLTIISFLLTSYEYLYKLIIPHNAGLQYQFYGQLPLSYHHLSVA